MPPALVILLDDPDPDGPALAAVLDLGRQVGGVGRVLLFHPPDAERVLTAKSLGYRLWPQEGPTPGARYGNAFAQAASLGYEGAVVIRSESDLAAETISHAAALLEEHQGAILAGPDGAIALLALQEPQPTLFAGEGVPTADDFRNRAGQQRVRLVDLPADEAQPASR